MVELSCWTFAPGFQKNKRSTRNTDPPAWKRKRMTDGQIYRFSQQERQKNRKNTVHALQETQPILFWSNFDMI